HGVYAGTEDPGGNYPYQAVNTQYRPKIQVDANNNPTKLQWSTDGKQLLNVGDALGNQTAFVYDSADRLAASTDAEGRRTLYAYESADAPRQPTLILVTDGSNLAVNGDMEDDSDWSSVVTP